MRVLSVLFSLLCLSGVSAQYALLSSSSTTNGYNWNTTAGANPTLSLNAGNSYNFDVSAITTTTPQHPFIFSSAQATVTTLDANVFTLTVPSACTTVSGGYVGAGCILTLAINATAANQTIWYKCTFHPSMVGVINIMPVPANTTGNTTGNATTVAPTTVAPTTVAPTTLAPTTAAPSNNGTSNATTAAPTTTAPTTATPTTPAPTTPAPTAGATITSNSFKITGNNLIAAYYFTHNGVVYSNPTLKVTANVDVTFTFDASFTFGVNHPFAFSNNATTTMSPNSFNSTDVFPDDLQTYTITTPTTCIANYFGIKAVTAKTNQTCTITVPAAKVQAGASLYYRCVKHPMMIGQINVVAAPTGSSSTGGNSASTIALSGLSIVFAMIVAMMA